MTGTSNGLRLFCLMLIAVAMLVGAAYGQSPSTLLMPPLPHEARLRLQNNPDALRDFMSRLPAASATLGPTPQSDPASPWQPLTKQLDFSVSNPLLLTDGTVLVHRTSTPDWWRLSPDVNGSYSNGTWSQIASLPSGYAPRFFASAVLPDGRVIMEGDEYNYPESGKSESDTTRGAIYDPLANSWKSVPPPSGWTSIGDAASVVLPDGTFMLANALTSAQALLNESNLYSLNKTSKRCVDDAIGGDCSVWTATGRGKADKNEEEGWTLLWDGSLLTVDVYSCDKNSERYLTWLGSWISAGNTGRQLVDCNIHEVGPQILRPDGTVIAFPATSGVARAAIFYSLADNHPLIADNQSLPTVNLKGSGPWASGPAIPMISGENYTLKDAPAALLPSGNVLFAASPHGASSFDFKPPTHFFELEYATNKIIQVADPSVDDAKNTHSYQWNFLLLPTGQILACETDLNNIWIYTSSSNSSLPNQAWAPSITEASVPDLIGSGQTYTIDGRRFNGLSQGTAYGDDQQAATNYPLVRIVNWKTKHVFYARTFGHSTMGVGPNNLHHVQTNFTVPTASRIETGLSTLQVVANGIGSAAVEVFVY
jgi:hypothetical protein